MSKLMPSEIKEEVERILREKINANVSTNPFVTAYQIYEKLPSDIKARLTAERGHSGKGSGNYYAAASVVSDAAELLENIEIETVETTNMQFLVDQELIEPGNQNVGLYRLKK